MNTGDILLAACNVLDERGWCQGIAENNQGNVCALGALGVACNGDARSWEGDVQIAKKELIKYFPGNCLAAWNNRRGRTVEDVKELFAKVAANLGTTLQEKGK